jgi:ribonuclease HII
VRRAAGLDEAGRGPLAGPVVAAAVILPPYCQINGVKDSKELTPKQRANLFEKIKSQAISFGIG